jgi:hypothetical protein
MCREENRKLKSRSLNSSQKIKILNVNLLSSSLKYKKLKIKHARAAGRALRHQPFCVDLTLDLVLQVKNRFGGS